jgi:tape measure domain-containing protein
MAVGITFPLSFTVSNNEVTVAAEQINATLKKQEDYLVRLGKSYDDMTRKEQARYKAMQRNMATYDDAAKYVNKLIAAERALNQEVKNGNLTDDQRIAMMRQRRELANQALADEKRAILERKNAQAAGGSAVRGGGAAGVPPISQSVIQSFNAANSGAKTVLETVNKLSFSIFVLTFGTQQLGQIFLRAFVQVGEKVEQQRMRMELLTRSTDTFMQVFGAAQSLGVGFEGFAASFTRLAVANAQMGLSNANLVQMTKNIAALGLIGGGTMQEITAGMQQLAQGFASGRFQGDELKSVLENLPYLAFRLAESLKVGVGELREMGKAGTLTPKVLSKAFLGMTQDLEKMMENVPVTSERGLARISNAWDQMINTMLRAGGVDTVGEMFSGWAAGLQSFNDMLADNGAEVQAVLSTLIDLLEKGLVIFAGWKGLLFLAGVAGKIETVTKAFKAYQLAVAATTAAEVALGAKVGATSAVMTAQVAAAGALRTALLGMLGPAAAIAAIAGYAWYTYSENLGTAVDGTQDAVDKLLTSGEALLLMTRRQILEDQRKANIQRGLEAASIKALEAEISAREKQNELANKSPGQSVLTMTNQGLPFVMGQAEFVAKNTAEIERLKGALDNAQQSEMAAALAVDAGSEALQGVEGPAMRAAASTAEFGKVMKDLFKDADNLTESLRKVENALVMAAVYGTEAGKMQSDRLDFIQEYNDKMATIYAAAKDGDADAIRAANVLAKQAVDVLNMQLRQLDAQKALNDLKSAEKETGKEGLKTLQDIVALQERASKLPVASMTALWQMEGASSGNTKMTNSRGAMSPWQIMPATAKGYGASNLLDMTFEEQTKVAARIFSDLFKQYEAMAKTKGFSQRKVLELTYAGYHAGEGAVKAAGYNVPNTADKNMSTKEYVASAMAIRDKQIQEGGLIDPLLAKDEASLKRYTDKTEEMRMIREAGAQEEARINAQFVIDMNNAREEAGASDEAFSARAVELVRQREADIAAIHKQQTAENQAYAEETQRILLDALPDSRAVDAHYKELMIIEAEYEAQKRQVAKDFAEQRVTDQMEVDKRLEALAKQHAAKLQAIEDAKEQALTQSIAGGMNTIYKDLIDGSMTFDESMKKMLQSLRDMIVQMLVLQPIAHLLAQTLNGIGGGGTGSYGSFIGSFLSGTVTNWATGGMVSSSLPSGIYSQPTMFPMATPGVRAFASGIGLLGEAGPEAVLPLTRGTDGKLGVQGGGGSAINVTVNTLPGTTAQVTRAPDGGVTIDMVETYVAAAFATGGNRISRAAESAYPGLRRGGR